MKKIIIILACVVLTTLILSCGNEKININDIIPEEEIINEAEDNIVVGFSQVGSESDWRLANTQSYINEFTEENGYYFLYEDGQQKQENQIKAVRNFILMGVDYIVLAPIVESGWDGVLQEAKDAEIPVILVDRKVDVESSDLYTCWVGSDSKEEGRIAGRWLERYLRKTGRSEEEINLVTIQGTLESSAQIGRTAGFKEILDNHGNWNMLAYESGDFTQAKGQEVMDEFLKKYKEIDVVVCENDNMAFGAIAAIKDAGKTSGPDGDIIIISFDAVRAAFEAMIEGDLNVSIECNPLHGPKVRAIIEDLERGVVPDKKNNIDIGIYPAETAEQYIAMRSY